MSQGFRILLLALVVAGLMVYAFWAVIYGVGSTETRPLAAPSAEDKSWDAARLAESSLLLGAARADGRLVAVGEYGHILLSDDEGKTWRRAKSVPTKTTLTAVYFVDPDNGWAVGHDTTVLYSSDKGESWIKQYSGKAESDKALLTVHFSDKLKGMALGAFNFTLETADGGKTWIERQLVATAPANPPAGPVATPPAGTAPAGDEDLQKKADAEAEAKAKESGVGAAYQAQTGDEAHLNAAFAGADGALFVAAEAGAVYRSLDAGKTFEKVQTPYIGSFWGGVTMADKSVLVVGMRGNIWRSADQGSTWAKVETGVADQSIASVVIAPDGTIVAVGLSGQILVSRDGGKSFLVNYRDDRKGLNAVIATMDGRYLGFGEVGLADITEQVKGAAAAPL